MSTAEARPAKSVRDTTTRLAQIMTPLDANFLGNVFGGSLLALIDLCASSTAQRFSGQTCVTASFDRVDFHEPIHIGELVTLTGQVSFVGRTSMEVTIDVEAMNLKTGENRHTNTARVTMVALVDGRPAIVPRLVCDSREEKVAYLEGQFRRQARADRLAELRAVQERLQASSDAELDQLMAGR